MTTIDPSLNQLWRLVGETGEVPPPVVVHLRGRDVVIDPGLPELYAYFPLTAVLSIVSTMEDGSSAEVALIGREGMVGLAGILGAMASPATALVQIPGAAVRVPMAGLRRARQRSTAVREVLDRYTEARLIQVAQTAACNRLHPVEARLARWLLAVAERIDGDQFTLAQDLMAQMLGVHRPTVSTAFHALKTRGLVGSNGRSVIIADRAGLEQASCECHAVVRREYDRLLRGAVKRRATTGAAESPPDPQISPETVWETTREMAGRLLLSNLRERQARDQAEAANRSKDQFLAIVSHELRTPLNAIIGWCEIARTDQKESPDRALTVIDRNAQDLLRLVDELLDAARLSARTLAIHPALVNLSDVVRDVVDSVTPAARAKGVPLRLSMRDDVLQMAADPDRLRQVFINVLSNALKFTDAPGSVEVCVTATADRVRVAIRDTGHGIPDDLLPHVFDPFRQGADATGSRSGLGLGLAIARAVVEGHQGTIHLASGGQDLGTTCLIELPLTSRVGAEVPVDSVTS